MWPDRHPLACSVHRNDTVPELSSHRYQLVGGGAQAVTARIGQRHADTLTGNHIYRHHGSRRAGRTQVTGLGLSGLARGEFQKRIGDGVRCHWAPARADAGQHQSATRPIPSRAIKGVKKRTGNAGRCRRRIGQNHAAIAYAAVAGAEGAVHGHGAGGNLDHCGRSRQNRYRPDRGKRGNAEASKGSVRTAVTTAPSGSATCRAALANSEAGEVCRRRLCPHWATRRCKPASDSSNAARRQRCDNRRDRLREIVPCPATRSNATTTSATAP